MESPDVAVLIIIALFLLPFPILLTLDIFQANLRIAGTAITRLQEILMQRYLNLDDHALRAVAEVRGEAVPA